MGGCRANAGGSYARKCALSPPKLVTFLWTSLSLGVVLNHEREAVTSRPDALQPAARLKTLNGLLSEEHRACVPRTFILALGNTFLRPRVCDSPQERYEHPSPERVNI